MIEVSPSSFDVSIAHGIGRKENHMTDIERRNLFILGAGIRGVDHLTNESLAILGKVGSIISLGHIDGLAELARREAWSYEDVSKLYIDGAKDYENYDRIKRHVLSRLDKESSVAFIVPGHPRLGVTVVQDITAMAGPLYGVTVIPGLSSFDLMTNDLQMDPLEEGSVLVDANRFLLFDYQIDCRLNCFMYHVCSVGNQSTHFIDPTIGNRIDMLKQKLLKQYRVDQRLILIKSAESCAEKTTFHETTLSNVEAFLPHITFSSTLFIPATAPRKQDIDSAFLGILLARNNADLTAANGSPA